MKELGRPEDAVDCYVRADALKPGLPDVPTNCGAALRELNRLDEAAQCYEEALRRQPDHPEARWNRGVVRLLRGEFAAGWEDYEWRWRVPGLLPPQRQFTQPEWAGGPLEGRTILLHAEQGFGDTLQFIRYAPLLAARGATVLVQCQPALASLLQTVPGVTRVFTEGAPLPEFDCHAPLPKPAAPLGNHLGEPPGPGAVSDRRPGSGHPAAAGARQTAAHRLRVGGQPGQWCGPATFDESGSVAPFARRGSRHLATACNSARAQSSWRPRPPAWPCMTAARNSRTSPPLPAPSGN